MFYCICFQVKHATNITTVGLLTLFKINYAELVVNKRISEPFGERFFFSLRKRVRNIPF